MPGRSVRRSTTGPFRFLYPGRVVLPASLTRAIVRRTLLRTSWASKICPDDRHSRPHVHWALVEAAVHASRQGAPDVVVYRMTRARRDATVARLTVARKIGKRVYHTLRELELEAAA